MKLTKGNKLMSSGGKRPGAGRPKSDTPMVRRQYWLRQDQVDFLDTLPRQKNAEFVRAAIDEKMERDYSQGWRKV
jgi:hypothetical protein